MSLEEGIHEPSLSVANMSSPFTVTPLGLRKPPAKGVLAPVASTLYIWDRPGKAVVPACWLDPKSYPPVATSEDSGTRKELLRKPRSKLRFSMLTLEGKV